MSRNPWRLQRGALAVVPLLLAATASAGHLAPPVPEAKHAMVADPLFGLGAGQAGELFSIKPDEQTGAASVGKTWTLHMALHAIEEGIIDDPQELVNVSKDAASRACTCLTDMAQVEIAEGEKFRFWDALHAMQIRSANDISQAVGEHIGMKKAAKAGGSCALHAIVPNPWFPSPCLQIYLDWANEHVHSPAVGASADTVFEKSWTADKTTARDVLKWWVHALQDPTAPDFLAVAGFVGTYNFASEPPFSKSYQLTRSAGSYPGWEASKPGSNTICNGTLLQGNHCWVSSHFRIGRRLVASQMQSFIVADAQAMYDHGFARVFHPAARGASAPWQPVQDHALACVGPNRAVSAAITTTGQTKLLLWGADLGKSLVQLLDEAGAGVVPATANFQLPPPPDPGPLPPALRALPDAVPPHGPLLRGLAGPIEAWLDQRGYRTLAAAGNGAVEPAWDFLDDTADQLSPRLAPATGPVAQLNPALGLTALQVEIAAMAHEGAAGGVAPSGVVLVAQRTALDVKLSTFRIAGPGNGQLVHLDGPVSAGPGLDVRVRAMTPDRAAVAVLGADKTLRLQSWGVDGQTGKLTHLATGTDALGSVEEFDLAAVQDFATGKVVAAARTTAGGARLALVAWSVYLGDGSISLGGAWVTPGEAKHIRITPHLLSTKPGPVQGLEPATYAVAFRNPDGLVHIRFFRVDGGIADLGETTTTLPVAPSGRLELNSLGRGGLLAAVKPGIGTPPRLAVLEAWPDGGAVAALQVVEHVHQTQGIPAGMCRLAYPGPAPSEGDHLLAYEDMVLTPDGAVEALRLTGWRSGPRPG